MFENVAEYVDEAVRLAERCPEKYQIPCFEDLIRVLAQSDSPLPQNGNGHPDCCVGDCVPGYSAVAKEWLDDELIHRVEAETTALFCTMRFSCLHRHVCFDDQRYTVRIQWALNINC